ncbi:MAG TPA: MBL fold metallo-hydrolase [Desulfosalsimonadaceae bacterium]|nr:MBL fold metallo-hydrolase [Desulfosalsimonadaceae bacterium]
MKITIIYDNTTLQEALQPDWGFSALVEYHEKTILFDTGANGAILLSNMEKLGINPESIEDVVISHAHFDHAGGLSAFLNANNRVRVWCPPTFRGVKNAGEVIDVDAPRKLYDGIYSTGELEGIEQSMCCETRKGIVIIVGCSHPSMDHIIEVASQFGRVYAVIGGMHGTPPKMLADVGLICPTHCTMHKTEMQSLYAEKYIEGGAGCRIEIE